MPDSAKVTALEFSKLSELAAEQFIKIIQETLKKQSRFTCALAGGKSPEPFYQALAKFKNEKFWDKVYLFTTDERFVPAGHDYNNFSMLQRNLLAELPIPKGNCYPMPVDLASPELAAKMYEAEIQRFFNLKTGQFPQFDAVLLGLGEDGHTASLFPVVPQWKEKQKLVISLAHKSVEYGRLSLTLPVLNNARHVIFFVHGEKKADVMKKVLAAKSLLPAAQVKPLKGKLYFWLDQAAAKKIRIQ